MTADSSRRRRLAPLAAFALLGIFGALRLPFETRLDAEHRAAGFRPARLGLDLRERLGQAGFLAALSGCRAVVADVLCLQASTAWERVEWGRMNWLFQTATALAPRAVFIWDMAGWHMGYNASRAAREDSRQPREALRIKAEREYLQLARDFLERGIANNPAEPRLREQLGTLLRDKLRDPLAASQAFDAAAALPGARAYLKRFAAYCLAQVPGKEREAHSRLRALYDLGPQEHLPSVLRDLKHLEEKLSLPPEQRIYKAP